MNVTVRGRTRHYRTISFEAAKNQVRLIEQRLLPHEFKVVGTRDFRATAVAIRDMVVRGAGAIGATAAYGLAQGARAFRGKDLAKFQAHIAAVFTVLDTLVTKYLHYWGAVLGAILTALVVLFPRGLLGAWRRAGERDR